MRIQLELDQFIKDDCYLPSDDDPEFDQKRLAPLLSKLNNLPALIATLKKGVSFTTGSNFGSFVKVALAGMYFRIKPEDRIVLSEWVKDSRSLTLKQLKFPEITIKNTKLSKFMLLHYLGYYGTPRFQSNLKFIRAIVRKCSSK